VDRTLDFSLIDFVFFFPEDGRWDNNQGRNYQIQLSGPERPTLPPTKMLKEKIRQENISHEHVYQIDRTGQLAVIVGKAEAITHIILITDIPAPLLFHWGVARRSRYEWLSPPSSMCPAGTTVFQNKAAQTPFVDHGDFRRLDLAISEQEAPMGISFVLKRVDTGRWLKSNGSDFYIPLASPPKFESSLRPTLAGLAEEIIENEMGRKSWTLMHRFNLCCELLDKVRDPMEGLGLIFVWLRFSAIRQLDWQRNYNTKPRELSDAQDRLTRKLTDHFADHPAVGELIRLIMTTLGRGGEGQRIRDEILNIMHRHKIKEVSGHFLEEWHQKLHNNTTPDDVVICEAYLDFLRSDGDLDLFYERLEAGGVTKKRLESYERPIRSKPDFVPHLKEVLIQDSEHFLEILKSVHSGTDLGTAINGAKHLFDEEIRGLMNFIWGNRDEGMVPLCELVGKITETRRCLNKQLRERGDGMRDLLFLDLALEDFLRIAVERNLHSKMSGNQLVELIAMVLENLCLSQDDEELGISFRHWERLREIPRFGIEWSLQAEAVLDRVGRILSSSIDGYYQLFQPKAEDLGKAFHADPWAITLFSEEVVRGRPAFVLAMLLRNINPILRKAADLCKWQVISRGRGMGQVEIVDILRSIQGKSFDRPTVIVANKVAGDEQIPEQVSAIITPDTTDVVSHVAVRARNAHLLFATCYDPEMIEKIKSLSGHLIKLGVDAAGDVIVEESSEENEVAWPHIHPARVPLSRPRLTTSAVSAADFNENTVGGKSNNLARLQGKLPEWVGLPISVALPFGVFERVLAEDVNQKIAAHYEELTRQVDEKAREEKSELLGHLRESILALEAPKGLASSLHEVMEGEGLAGFGDWREAWKCIKRVWSSKWNERAYLSRMANGIPHENLLMAVIVQEVIEAEYGFVIHTVNPLTGNSDEVYAEVVLGLGETLVGNYPGRALSFTCDKGGHDPRVRSFPAKSVGLFGSGLIFRSDSNGEDLADYAGAGLYDSIMLEPPREVCLDYSHEQLVWDRDFRKDLLNTIAVIGTTVEVAMAAPQDIEGVYAKGKYTVVQTRPQVGTESE
jgi:alpha-glucan,water dikinase